MKPFYIAVFLTNLHFAAHQSISGKNSSTPPLQLPDCMNVTIEAFYTERFGNGSVRINTGYDSGAVEIDHFSSNETTVTVCQPLSPQLLHCNTSRLEKQHYTIENHTLFCGATFVAGLGDYYIDGCGNAQACDPPIRTDRATPRCNYVHLKGDDYVVLPNGSFYIKPAKVLVDPASYTIDNTSWAAILCYPLSLAFLNCDPSRRKTVPKYFYIVQKNLQLYYTSENQLFGLGDYHYQNAKGDVVFCLQPDVVVQIIIGLMVVSDVSLFLAFLSQLILPKWTRHTKSFMSHNMSLAVSCSWYTDLKILQISWHPHTNRYVAFIIGYFSALATAVWLAIIGYDVYRSFAKLTLAPNQHQSSTSHKHTFRYYSICGWGVPAVFLATVLTVQYSPVLQDLFNLHLNLASVGWFHDHKTANVFYYGPLVAVTFANAICFGLVIHRLHLAGKGTTLANNRRKTQL